MGYISTTGFGHLSLGVLDKSRDCVAMVRVAARMCDVQNVQVFGGQEDIVEFLKAGSPDNVLLLHVEPPVETGLELCRAIRNRETSPCPFLPIVALSQHATREHVRTARDAGVDEFLATPFTPKAFRERLGAIVFQRRGFVEVESYFGPDRRRGAMARMLGAERRGAPSPLIDPRTERVYLG